MSRRTTSDDSYRFDGMQFGPVRQTWRMTGIQLAHSGLILLLVGELVSGLLQKYGS